MFLLYLYGFGRILGYTIKQGVNMNEMLTVQQVGEILELKPQTVLKWIRAGKIPSVRLTKKAVRVSRVDLDAFISNKRIEAV